MLQGLPPILPVGPIRALILGSFPSVQSLERQQYYAHPQNWFWRVLQHCGVVDDAGAPYAERVAQVRARQIAIWDLYERVRREGSGDDQIRDAVPNRIGDLLESRDPFPILLNGRRLKEFRRAFPDIEAELIALPSTSPRPLHWNTEASRSAAIGEWYAALSINAESG
ncbi:MAG: DNA-deoxyinosine glycosylase [Chloroflexi bacterium]|nr:DNA-deoxyinosine glycosylase [Chloroflexota bacterium]MYI03673.1 DNA-deoxyinosine glycosylase [Chloroflexota bacterium]